MRRTSVTIKPIDIVNAYGKLGFPAVTNAAQQHEAATKLWKTFGTRTAKVMSDGCRTLAMLWDSAWKEGNGQLVSAGSLGEVSATVLRDIYEQQNFLKSVPLNEIQKQIS
jgi:hypothetical protein